MFIKDGGKSALHDRAGYIIYHEWGFEVTHLWLATVNLFDFFRDHLITSFLPSYPLVQNVISFPKLIAANGIRDRGISGNHSMDKKAGVSIPFGDGFFADELKVAGTRRLALAGLGATAVGVDTGSV